MIISTNAKPYAAISYDTVTYNDLLHYSQCEILLISPEEFLNNSSDEYQYINLITLDLALRKQISTMLDQKKLQRFSYIHESSLNSASIIGQGVFVYPGCVVYPNVCINDDVLMHAGCVLGHKVKIDKGTILGIGVSVSGSSIVGKFCFLGIKACLIDHVTVCDDVVIGAQGLVLKNIESSGTYVGNPVKYLNCQTI